MKLYPNRYNELTKEQQAMFDVAINSKASGTGVTIVLHRKEHQARLRAAYGCTDMTDYTETPDYELAMGFDN